MGNALDGRLHRLCRTRRWADARKAIPNASNEAINFTTVREMYLTTHNRAVREEEEIGDALLFKTLRISRSN
jgi:hypothetical protein